MIRLFILAAAVSLFVQPTAAQESEGFAYLRIASPALPPVRLGSIDVADYNLDRQPDIALSGGAPTRAWTKVFRFAREDQEVTMGGRIIYTAIFVDPTTADIEQSWLGTVRWGDLNGDGRPDLLATGSRRFDPPFEPSTQVYLNRGDAFIRTSTALPDVYNSMAAWGDYDGDGDEDLALAGRTATGLVTGVYRNEGGQLLDISAGLPGLEQGSIEWIDLDGDGDLDLTVSGALESGRLVTQIYRNDAGQFTRIEAELPGVLYGTATWSDYDGDGDPDLLIAGGLYGPELIEGFTQLYRNDAGALTPVDAGLTPIANGNAEWGDYDGDGDPDLLLAGPANVVDARTYRIRVFKNEAGTFRQVFEESGLALGEATWWDYTGNGTLDILSVGQDNNGRPRTDLYRVVPRQF